MKKICLWLLLIGINLNATDYGLIIGIGEYKTMSSLHNVNEDIQTYVKILKNWGILKPIVLKDKNATKENILKALDFIVTKIERDDRFFMFFSGHGSNLQDESFFQKFKDIKIRESIKNSGAILPYDFDEKNFIKTMIIGKIDLKKRLKKIDDSVVESLIVFDSCFSKNSIKNIGNMLNLTPNILTDTEDYPYKNIVYIASSIIQAKAGKFSPILDKCLVKPTLLDEIKTCINEEIGGSMQIPVIFTKNKSLNFQNIVDKKSKE
jgi:hypothetical protein